MTKPGITEGEKKGSKSKQQARCLETGLKIGGWEGGTFPYSYFRVSAPKHLDFEERAGEREKRTFIMAKRPE